MDEHPSKRQNGEPLDATASKETDPRSPTAPSSEREEEAGMRGRAAPGRPNLRLAPKRPLPAKSYAAEPTPLTVSIGRAKADAAPPPQTAADAEPIPEAPSEAVKEVVGADNRPRDNDPIVIDADFTVEAAARALPGDVQEAVDMLGLVDVDDLFVVEDPPASTPVAAAAERRVHPRDDSVGDTETAAAPFEESPELAAAPEALNPTAHESADGETYPDGVPEPESDVSVTDASDVRAWLDGAAADAPQGAQAADPEDAAPVEEAVPTEAQPDAAELEHEPEHELASEPEIEPEPEDPAVAAERRRIEAGLADGEDEFVAESRLGSLLHGARATLGKRSLLEVEADLRIKAKFLEAIEKVDIAGLPSQAYLSSFVRSYARYLEDELPLTPDQAVRKFGREYEAKTGMPLKISKDARRMARAEPRQKMAIRSNPAAPSEENLATSQESRAATATPPEEGVDGVSESVRLRRRDRSMETPQATPTRIRDSRAAPRPIPKGLFKPRQGGALRNAAPNPAAYDAPKASIGRGIASFGLVVVAFGIVGAVAMAGWTVLEQAQQMRSAEATSIAAGTIERRDVLAIDRNVRRPSAEAYEEGGVLAEIYEPPPLRRADGPIAELDPSAVGVFAEPAPQTRRDASILGAPGRDGVLTLPADERSAPGALASQIDPSQLMAPPSISADGGEPLLDREFADLPTSVLMAVETLSEEVGRTAPRPPAALPDEPAYALRAVAPAWVRVENAAQETVFTGNMNPGDMQQLPLDQGVLRLRTGNAGGSVIVVRGVAYGPVGAAGRVRTLAISPEEITGTLPQLPEVTEAIAREHAERVAAEAAAGGAVQ